MEAELGRVAPASPRHTVHGPAVANDLDVAVLGAVECFLAAEELLGSFFLHARAWDAAGHVVEPRALAPGRRLGAEVVEALRELLHPWQVAGEAASEMVQETLRWR